MIVHDKVATVTEPATEYLVKGVKNFWEKGSAISAGANQCDDNQM